MRLRAHRRNMVVWSQSASSIGRYGAPPFTRTRRIRRWKAGQVRTKAPAPTWHPWRYAWGGGGNCDYRTDR